MTLGGLVSTEFPMKMIPWGGISCCLSAAALYLLRQKAVAAQLLDTDILPLVVSISGRVGSETPINCEFSGLRGVIVEETAEQHFLKHNDAGSWIQDSALMLSMSKEVPWYLDDGTDRVHVVGARGATGFVLPVGSEAFEESGRSLVRGTLDYLQGLKMLGVKRIERVLPVGTSLTVVGEAAKDDIGTIRIQRPHKGPFYVSPKTVDQLIANLGKWARWYKYASVGLTVFGAYLIAKHFIRYFLERRRRYELQKRVLAAASKRSGQDNEGEKTDSLSDGAKKDRLMPDLCVICLEQEYNAVFVPLLFALDQLSSLPATDREGSEDFSSLSTKLTWNPNYRATWNEESYLKNPRVTIWSMVIV
ncbi:E3 Ubiquitin ligase, GIDE-type [Sesbania bispinosa]|nr:E3 Ubiquitin ligase, GIDE-type [Sesbania bispinosa]